MDVTSFQKIYGLYSVEHHKVEKWSYKVGCGWVLWVWLVCVGDGGVGSGSVDSGCHQLSENIWFMWSKMSYSGDMEGCHDVKIGLEFWKQNSQYIVGLILFSIVKKVKTGHFIATRNVTSTEWTGRPG